MKMEIFGNEKGVALLVVITFATVISLIAAYVLRLSYNQARQVDAVSIRRTMNNYRAQAGVVDAMWRIRTNTIPPGSAGSFLTPTFDPLPYFINVNDDTASAGELAASNVRVDIGPVITIGNAIGTRRIVSAGLDK